MQVQSNMLTYVLEIIPTVSVEWKSYVMVCECASLPTLLPVISCWELKIGPDSDIYTTENEKCYKLGFSFPEKPLLTIDQYTTALANSQKCSLPTTTNIKKRMAEGKSERDVAGVLTDSSWNILLSNFTKTQGHCQNPSQNYRVSSPKA